MKARRTHNVVATIGTYKGRDGAEKKRYATCGTAFTGEDGRLSFKLEVVPVSPEWSGWFKLYEIEDRREEQPIPAAGRYENSDALSRNEPTRDPLLGDEDIPF